MKNLILKIWKALKLSTGELWAGFVMFLTIAESIVYFTIYAKYYTGDTLGYYFALIISMIIGTFVVGMISGVPFIVSCGIGINTFIFTIVMGSNGLGFSYYNILFLLLIDGIIYLILSFIGKNGLINRSIPDEVMKGIPIAIGMLLIISGIDMALYTNNNSIYSFQVIGLQNTEVLLCLLLAVILLFLLIYMKRKKVKLALFIVVILGTLIYILFKYFVYHSEYIDLKEIYNFNEGIEALKSNYMFKAIHEGLDFSSLTESYGMSKTIALSVGVGLVLLMYIMYTAEAVSTSTILLGKYNEDERKNLNKRISISSASSTIIGAIFGAPCISLSEMSICGCVERGRTRLSTLSMCLFLILAITLYPLIRIVPNCVLSVIVIYSGLVLATNIKEIRWNMLEEGIPVLLMVATTIFTKNISAGVGLGMISYIVLKIIKKEVNEINKSTWFFACIFLLTLILSF